MVNGKFPLCTVVSVAAEKKVDFPTLAFPSYPICIRRQSLFDHISITEIH